MASRERLRRLHDATAEMTRSLDVGHRIRTAVRAARSLESAEAASLMLRDETSDALVISAQEGPSEADAGAKAILGIGTMSSLAELRDALDVRVLRTGESVPAGSYPLDRALRGETSAGEFFITQKSTGQRRDLSVNAAPVHGNDGGVIGAVMTVHDVTDIH